MINSASRGMKKATFPRFGGVLPVALVRGFPSHLGHWEVPEKASQENQNRSESSWVVKYRIPKNPRNPKNPSRNCLRCRLFGHKNRSFH